MNYYQRYCKEQKRRHRKHAQYLTKLDLATKALKQHGERDMDDRHGRARYMQIENTIRYLTGKCERTTTTQGLRASTHCH